MLAITVFYQRADLVPLWFRALRKFTPISDFLVVNGGPNYDEIARRVAMEYGCHIITGAPSDGAQPSTSHARALDLACRAAVGIGNGTVDFLILDQDCFPCTHITPGTCLSDVEIASHERHGIGCHLNLSFPSPIVSFIKAPLLPQLPSWEPIWQPDGYADTGARIGQWLQSHPEHAWRRFPISVHRGTGFDLLGGAWLHFGESSHNWSNRSAREREERNIMLRTYLEDLLR